MINGLWGKIKLTIVFFYIIHKINIPVTYSKSSMNYNLNVNDKKMNILLSIFLTGALILAPLGVNTNAFAQGGAANTANSAINQAKICTKCSNVLLEL